MISTVSAALPRIHHGLHRPERPEHSSSFTAMARTRFCVADRVYCWDLWGVRCGWWCCGLRTRWQQYETHKHTHLHAVSSVEVCKMIGEDLDYIYCYSVWKVRLFNRGRFVLLSIAECLGLFMESNQSGWSHHTTAVSSCSHPLILAPRQCYNADVFVRCDWWASFL